MAQSPKSVEEFEEQYRQLLSQNMPVKVRFRYTADTTRAPLGAAVNEKANDRYDTDLSMLYEWGVQSRLTPLQMEYTFKKLINSVSVELQEFEQERKRREQWIVQKGARLNQVKGSGLEAEVKREMKELFEECPLYFLYEIKDGCTYNPDEDDTDLGVTSRSLRRSLSCTFSRRPPSPPRPQSPQHHGEGNGKVHKMQAAKTYQRFLSLIAEDVVGRGGGPRTFDLMSSRRLQPAQGATAMAETILDVIAAVVEELVEDISSGRHVMPVYEKPKVPGRIKVKWNASQTSYYREYPGRNDGRLSLDEFARVLYSAGISWLTKAELERNFSAMDVDQSGYLSLGEILRVSERLLEHVRHLMEHAKELDKNRPHLYQELPRKLQFGELLESYIESNFSKHHGAAD
eukprot:CAMPEP_0177275854 /NCGR_PEP_ID=MMETSP0367-20130122/67945_1 /TAXON_ID=447022 ORGANISM="Scrippsiella hangoei-like, Strain SHHI-4" /NCGR_SAMPLE_ID=MMETSP0367 /ASSEMBLY_ACC=CAM_ASM_000362 /LENGTH=401 /DNA_ID=CAMNT_0018732329 /DNA_START=27 /DNA_END=1230 /DNA_ORIENTATION=-